jgi:hypothetical protein
MEKMMDGFEALAQTLKQTQDRDELFKVAHQLGDLGDHRAVPILIDLLESTKDGTVRNAAAAGLRKLRDSRAVPYILEQLKADYTTGNRGTLMYALETLDITENIVEVVKVMCNDNYEVVHMGLRVIEAQKGAYPTHLKFQAIQIIQNSLEFENPPDWKEAFLSDAIAFLEDASEEKE